MANYIVGLTGGIGSGKSAASDYFESLGIDCIDADRVSRDVVLPGTPALAAIENHFGKAIIQDDGSLNRAALREIIFHKPLEKTWLEQLLHPLIRERITLLLEQSQSPYTLFSSPLLLETQQDSLVDRILVVDVPESIQIKRTLSRDRSSEETIKSILKSQIDRQSRLEHADDIVDNSGDIKFLHQQVDDLHRKYLKLAKN